MNVIDDYKRVHGIEQPQYQGETKLYDFAKEIVRQQKPISEDKLDKYLDRIASAIAVDCYYVLLINPDLRQYVFMVVPDYNVDDENETEDMIITVKDELRNILKARGDIIDIDMSNSDDMIWEIWIKDKFDKQIRMYQLCDYTAETITFGEEH